MKYKRKEGRKRPVDDRSATSSERDDEETTREISAQIEKKNGSKPRLSEKSTFSGCRKLKISQILKTRVFLLSIQEIEWQSD
jgi:hypothetical protein